MHRLSSRWRPPIQRKSLSAEAKAKNLERARAKHNQDNPSSSDPGPRTSHANEENPSTSSAETPKTGRTGKKIDLFGDADVTATADEYVLVHTSALQDLVKNFRCLSCGRRKVRTVLGDYKGSATKIVVTCASFEETQCEVDSSPRLPVTSADSSRGPYEINKRMVSAFTSNGIGHTVMTKVMSEIGVRCVDNSAYRGLFNKVTIDIEKVKEKVLQESRSVVRASHVELNPSLAEEDIIDIAVTVDGTGSWKIRGHTSLIGFVAVVDFLTGLVVDYIVLSKYCHECTASAGTLGEDTPEFDLWYQSHQSSGQCSKNFSGPSGNMESEGALQLWQRSVSDCKMRYTTFIADGDAKTWSELRKHQPYGPKVEIQKEECVNHVSKRMGTGLRCHIQTMKQGGHNLGGRGQGTLTEEKVKILQGYYQKALKSNIGNLKTQEDAILASLYHCASTNEKPRHQYCPKEKDSSNWCTYNRERQGRTKSTFNHDKMTVQLNEKVFNSLLPVYKRLSSKELLQRCSRGATQNANEGLHAVIWNKSHKHSFASKQRVEMNILKGVGEFNMGVERFLAFQSQELEEPIPEVALTVAGRLDSRRRKKSDQESTPAAKKARVLRKKSVASKRAKERKQPSKYAAGEGD